MSPREISARGVEGARVVPRTEGFARAAYMLFSMAMLTLAKPCVRSVCPRVSKLVFGVSSVIGAVVAVRSTGLYVSVCAHNELPQHQLRERTNFSQLPVN